MGEIWAKSGRGREEGGRKGVGRGRGRREGERGVRGKGVRGREGGREGVRSFG